MFWRGDFRMAEENKTAGTSGMAIAGLVVGILALVSSWVPIINNFSFVLALIGAILAIVGVVSTVRGKKAGRGLAIAALVVNVVAIVVVLATQSAYSNAIDEATTTDVTSVSSTTDATTDEDGTTDEASGAAEADSASYTDLAIGTVITLDNGLSVTVDSYQTGLTNYDGSTVTCVSVRITNEGDEAQSFNEYDWKGEDANGVQNYNTYYGEDENTLGSGSIAAGGSAYGNIYFDGDIVKVLYYGDILDSTHETASWTIG